LFQWNRPSTRTRRPVCFLLLLVLMQQKNEWRRLDVKLAIIARIPYSFHPTSEILLKRHKQNHLCNDAITTHQQTCLMLAVCRHSSVGKGFRDLKKWLGGARRHKFDSPSLRDDSLASSGPLLGLSSRYHESNHSNDYTFMILAQEMKAAPNVALCSFLWIDTAGGSIAVKVRRMARRTVYAFWMNRS
jgi:hypothetical protein